MGFFTPKNGDIVKYISPYDPLEWSIWRIDGPYRICIDVGPSSGVKLGTRVSDVTLPFNDQIWSIVSRGPMAASAHPTLTQLLAQVRKQSDTKPQVSDETDKWQTWAHSAPGDCKCGIKRAQCEYHR